MTETDKWVSHERFFSAPKNRVWEFWTEPDLFSKWYGPNNAAITNVEMNVSTGGYRRVCMEIKRAGSVMHVFFIGEFTEVTSPSRLSYTERLCDADGNVLARPGQPEQTEIVVEFLEEQKGTRMKMTHVGIPTAAQGGASWVEALDKLAAFI